MMEPKLEITFPPGLIEMIADRVIEKLRPLLSARSQTDNLLDIKQVADLLGKSEGQIYQWVHNSTHGLSGFPFMKAGKSLRFSKNDVLQWMKDNVKRAKKTQKFIQT